MCVCVDKKKKQIVEDECPRVEKKMRERRGRENEGGHGIRKHKEKEPEQEFREITKKSASKEDDCRSNKLNSSTVTRRSKLNVTKIKKRRDRERERGREGGKEGYTDGGELS